MSDGVIDLRGYLKDRSEGRKGAFSLWGGEGERARFALPVWRVIYLVGGDWGGLLWGRSDHVPRSLKPFFILDLRHEPARTDVDTGLVDGLWNAAGPSLLDQPPRPVAVHLGTDAGRSWFLVVSGEPRTGSLPADVRDDVLFLAGECAGLLFHRDLANERG